MNLLNLGSTINSLTNTTNPPANAEASPLEAYQHSLYHLTQKILSSGYGGNSQQDWMGEKPGLSAKGFLNATGRIDGGIGTGDTPTYAPNGNISGYQSRNQQTLTGGTSLTPQAQWDAQFQPSETLAEALKPRKPQAPSLFINPNSKNVDYQERITQSANGINSVVGKYGTGFATRN